MKRFFTWAFLALLVMSAAACTREKPPVEEPTPTLAVGQAIVTPPPTTAAPGGVASPTTPASLPTIVVTTTVPAPVVLPTNPPAVQGTSVPAATATRPASPTTASPVTGATTAPAVNPTAAPTVANVPPGTATTYTVEWGDWLNKIAGKFSLTTQQLLAANPGLDANRIYPGQVINIPGAVATVPTNTPEATVEPGAGTPTPPPSTNPGTYTVQRGDWMYSIARKFGITVQSLQAANPNVNPNLLYPGQVLNIPGGTTTPGSEPPPPSTGGTTYKVQRGDTLFAIAVRFGKTVYALQIANHLANPNFIYPGQTLIIP